MLYLQNLFCYQNVIIFLNSIHSNLNKQQSLLEVKAIIDLIVLKLAIYKGVKFYYIRYT